MLPQCDIKLKPTRIPSKSKKIYRGIFVRKLQNFNHLYTLDGLYVVSLHKSREPRGWIDGNIEEIARRVSELNRVSNYNSDTNSIEKEIQSNLFS